MSEAAVEGGGGGNAASAESGSGISSGVEATASPITPESPIQAGEISDEATLDNATGANIADNIVNNADGAPGDTLQNIADGKTFTASQDAGVFKNYQQQMRTEQPDGDEPNIKPDSNAVTFGNVDEYRKNFASVKSDDVDAPTEISDKTTVNTPPDTKDQTPASSTPETTSAHPGKDADPNKAGDQAEPPAEDKKPEAENDKTQDKKDEDEQKPSDGEKKGEKDEDQKSEKEKQIEEKMQMADIVSQIKDINPDFDPKNPEAQDFLKNLAENSDQMNTAADTLKMLSEQKTVLENSDTIKNLGINPKDLAVPAAIGTLKALSSTIEKAINELANKANLTKEEKDKKEKDGILLLLLKMLGKAMGTALVVGGAAALTVGKEMKK